MAEIKIRGDIIPDSYLEAYEFYGFEATCPACVSDVLKNADAGELVHVYISSGGGDVSAGQEIYSMLRNDSRVRIHVDGTACSAASIIAMAGKSDISPIGLLMIHNVSSGAYGDHREMAHVSEVLKTFNQALAQAYREKSGMDEAELLKMMDKESWITAQRAVELGLIDAIAEPAQALDAVASQNGLKLTPEMIESAKAKIKAKQEQANEADKILNDIEFYGI